MRQKHKKQTEAKTIPPHKNTLWGIFIFHLCLSLNDISQVRLSFSYISFMFGLHGIFSLQTITYKGLPNRNNCEEYITNCFVYTDTITNNTEIQYELTMS